MHARFNVVKHKTTKTYNWLLSLPSLINLNCVVF
jgi:hypothetical protein